MGENITADTPLALFCMGDGRTVWIGGRARYIGGFGYGYPGLEDVSAVFFCFTRGRGREGSGRRKRVGEGGMLITTVGTEFEPDGAGCGQCEQAGAEDVLAGWEVDCLTEDGALEGAVFSRKEGYNSRE
jgi:hypothetical protein